MALPASELHISQRPLGCSFDSLRGAYAWTWPHEHEAHFVGTEDCRPLAERSSTLCAGDVHRARKFYVGDSNGGYMMWFGRLGNCNIPRKQFMPMNGAAGKTLKDKLEGILRTIGDRGDVIFLYMGSHYPELSPSELEQNVTAALRSSWNLTQRACIIVSGIMDPEHEQIPGKWSPNQVFFRNSWRVAMQNQAVRRAVLATNDDRIHYLDLFEPTLPLHFDAHRSRRDPVHFRSASYRFLGNVSLLAASHLCGLAAVPHH